MFNSVMRMSQIRVWLPTKPRTKKAREASKARYKAVCGQTDFVQLFEMQGVKYSRKLILLHPLWK